MRPKCEKVILELQSTHLIGSTRSCNEPGKDVDELKVFVETVVTTLHMHGPQPEFGSTAGKGSAPFYVENWPASLKWPLFRLQNRPGQRPQAYWLRLVKGGKLFQLEPGFGEATPFLQQATPVLQDIGNWVDKYTAKPWAECMLPPDMPAKSYVD